MSNPQAIAFNQFRDCLKRTKKKQSNSMDFHRTDDLFKAIIYDSSVIEDKGTHSFNRVCNAVSIFEKYLCPGQWCIRSHCKNHSTRHAYNCNTTRPSVCKEFENYLLKKIKKEHPDFKENEVAEKEILDIFTNEKYFTCSGMYFDEYLKKFVSYERTADRFYFEVNKSKTDALMFFIKHDRNNDLRSKELIRESLQNKLKSETIIND
jgi:hypothetical protein